jgi:hypothetical protein
LAKLPNAEKAIIESEKLYGYLLSFEHPIGRFKAEFFRKLGFINENWEEFEIKLRELVLINDAEEAGETPYGKKYVVVGILNSLSGEPVTVLTVWIILKGENAPRFISAYPGD